METLLRSFQTRILYTSTHRLVVYLVITLTWILVQNTCAGDPLLVNNQLSPQQHAIRHSNNKLEPSDQDFSFLNSMHARSRGAGGGSASSGPTGAYLVNSQCSKSQYMTIYKKEVSAKTTTSTDITARIAFVRKNGTDEYYIIRYKSYRYICFNHKGVVRVRARPHRERCSFKLIEDTPPPTNSLKTSTRTLSENIENNFNSSAQLNDTSESPFALTENPGYSADSAALSSDNHPQSAKTYRIQSVADPTWYLGFKKNGQVMRGWQYKMRRKKCFFLTLTPIQNNNDNSRSSDTLRGTLLNGRDVLNNVPDNVAT